MMGMKLVVSVLAFICLANLNYQSFLFQLRQVDEEANETSLERFLKITQQIIVQINNNGDCTCGCHNSPMLDCPPLYDINDVNESSTMKASKAIQEFMDSAQIQIKRSGIEMCEIISTIPENSLSSPMGGYCLHALYKSSQTKGIDRGFVKYPHSHRDVSIPIGFHRANPELLDNLSTFIRKEKMKSLVDFGAGIGSYVANLEELFPNMVFRGFDGAPDVDDYTFGYIKFLDLSLPQNLPQSDWVMSLNVGEHMPSTAEGMFIRNLHTNNCKGIILSWETPEQPGIGHVNLHTNHYLIKLFQSLGYAFDVGETKEFREGQLKNSPFQKSLLIFRRLQKLC